MLAVNDKRSQLDAVTDCHQRYISAHLRVNILLLGDTDLKNFR